MKVRIRAETAPPMLQEQRQRMTGRVARSATNDRDSRSLPPEGGSHADADKDGSPLIGSVASGFSRKAVAVVSLRTASRSLPPEETM